MSSSRVLFLPLSNVLGHLTRTFSFIEQLHKLDVDIHLAAGGHYTDLIKVLPEDIQVHQTVEFPSSASRVFGPIASYKTGKESDLANIESVSSLNTGELELRSNYLKKMVARDKEIMRRVEPDIIITDYRYTVTLLPEFSAKRIFHVANVLGYPSLYKRVKGVYFPPLDSANILVPGIRLIEQTDTDSKEECTKIHWCGHFRWQGWQRLYKDLRPPEADVLLCFGSTGNGSEIVPWLLKTISRLYYIVMLGDETEQKKDQENLYVANFGPLESFLPESKVICCHGGHGTVMESILHHTPMLIFPNNIEQLEIGRRVEELGLGILVDKPFKMLEEHELNAHIKQLMTDKNIKQNLKRYSEQLKQCNGLEDAASVVLNVS